MSFTRNCPKCGKELSYKSKYYLNRALKLNRLCKSCSIKGKKRGPHSEETRRKQSIANKGKTFSEEHRRKMSLSRGGDGTLDKGRFSDLKLKKWSKVVRDRDGCCQMCNTTENLHAHHIFPKVLLPDLAYDTNWGIALCSPCHIEIHRVLRDV